ncbi:MAG TPA: hypothetical protein VK190_04920 [Pseudoneobacillus sp.]|nr:hypothetical protein [Pseudoneobacillus sp.]
MKGLIQKPLFDDSVFKAGTAIAVRSRDYNHSKLVKGFTFNCLVIKCEPMKLLLGMITRAGNFETAAILIEDINAYDIDFLTEEKKDA